MSGLFHPTSIYAEFDNILYYTDSIVVITIMNMMTDNETIDTLFALPEEFFRLSEKQLQQELQNYRTQDNILLHFFDWTHASECENPIDFCNELYKTIIESYQPIIIDEVESIHFTSIANSLKILLADKMMTKLTIHMNYKNDMIMSEIITFFKGSDKVNFLFDATEDYFQEYRHNCYFISSPTDVDLILPKTKSTRPIEVMIPKYKCNLIPSKITDTEYSDLLDVSLTDDELLEKYNIELMTIDLPI